MSELMHDRIDAVVLHNNISVTIDKIFSIECDNEEVEIAIYGLPVIKRGDIFGIDVWSKGRPVSFYPSMICYKIHISYDADSIPVTTYYFMR